MKLALCLYTAAEPLALYSYIGGPFKIRTRDGRLTGEQTRNSLGIMKILIASIRRLHQDESYHFEGTTYRGEPCHEADVAMREKINDRHAHFGPGNVLHFAPLMSTS
jgi:hypothetical protein